MVALRTTVTHPGLRATNQEAAMKIVVIGGTGLIGWKTVAILRQGSHEAIAASPNTGRATRRGNEAWLARLKTC